MSKKKRYKIKDRNLIENEDGVIVGAFFEGAPDEDIQTIINSGEAMEMIQSFVEGVDRGVMKPRKTYNEFRRLIRK